MGVDLIAFLTNFLGTYTTNTYQVTENIIVNDALNGGFNTTTWTYDVIPNGVASLDIEYIARFILLMFIMNILYKTIKWSMELFANVSNPSRRKVNLK